MRRDHPDIFFLHCKARGHKEDMKTGVFSLFSQYFHVTYSTYNSFCWSWWVNMSATRIFPMFWCRICLRALKTMVLQFLAFISIRCKVTNTFATPQVFGLKSPQCESDRAPVQIGPNVFSLKTLMKPWNKQTHVYSRVLIGTWVRGQMQTQRHISTKQQREWHVFHQRNISFSLSLSLAFSLILQWR